MHHHADLLRVHAEQVMRLDDLQPLVEHGGAVHGDLRAHAPGGMAQNVFHAGVLNLLRRAVAQRAARSGEDEMAHGVALPRPQALEDGGMFAVYGQKQPVQRPGALHDELPSRHQCFLVGKEHAIAAGKRRPDVAQPGDADHGAERVVRAGVFQRPRRAVRPKHPFAEAHVFRKRFGLHVQRRHAGAKFPHQIKQFFRRRTGRQTDDPEALGVAARDVQRLRADGAGRAENGEFSLPVHVFIPSPGKTGGRPAWQRGCRPAGP